MSDVNVLINAANAAITDSSIDVNGNAVNNIKEEIKMSEVDNNVMVNGVSLFDLVSDAAEKAKYSGIKSFFVTESGENKDYLMARLFKGTHRISEAAYIIPKDTTKEEFAVVTFSDQPSTFTYVNRSAKDFIRRVLDIAKENHISMTKIFEQLTVNLTIEQKLKAGHEGEELTNYTSDGGVNNWFYDFKIEVTK